MSPAELGDVKSLKVICCKPLLNLLQWSDLSGWAILSKEMSSAYPYPSANPLSLIGGMVINFIRFY